MGPRWPVPEEIDRLFFRTFYRAMRGGSPLGWAVWQARQEVRQVFPGRADWLAYAYFGHPQCEPYLVRPARGFTLFEALDPPQDNGFRAGQSYRFRASYRAECRPGTTAGSVPRKPCPRGKT